MTTNPTLREALRGRESHPEYCALETPRPVRFNGETRYMIRWRDMLSGECGRLGFVQKKELESVIAALLSEIQAWRDECRTSTRES